MKHYLIHYLDEQFMERTASIEAVNHGKAMRTFANTIRAVRFNKCTEVLPGSNTPKRNKDKVQQEGYLTRTNALNR